MARITELRAWEALDSRGNPTVGCEVVLSDGATGSALVPAGASTGRHEARELRDGDARRYAGFGVRAAVKNVRTALSELVVGMPVDDLGALDEVLLDVAGGRDVVGANAVLGVSLAAAHARAASRGKPLYLDQAEDGPVDVLELPMPMVNIVSGGAHAGRSIDIQDVLVVPVGARSMSEAIEVAWRVRRSTADLARARGLQVDLVADEGGLGPALPDNESALALVTDAIAAAGLRPGPDAALAIDVAASELFEDGSYRLAREGRRLSGPELADVISGWLRDYPVVSVEDPLAEDDWATWSGLTHSHPGLQIVGDDLFVTDTVRLGRGIEERAASAVLVKPNQVGTLSAARGVVSLARRNGFATVLSARSGDTEDAWLADLAVGWRTGQIKVGSTTRSERTAKWNRLLYLEQTRTTSLAAFPRSLDSPATAG